MPAPRIDITKFVTVITDAGTGVAKGPIAAARAARPGGKKITLASAEVKLVPTSNARKEAGHTHISTLRDIVSAARSNRLSEVVRHAETLQRTIAESPESQLAVMSQHALNRALGAACTGGHARVAQELLEAGAEPTRLSRDTGLGPLEAAVGARSLPTVRVLLQHGQGPAPASSGSDGAHARHGLRRRYRGWRGAQALTLACELEEEEIVEALLDAGLPVTRSAIVAASPPPPTHSTGHLLPLLVQAHCTSPEVEAKGLRIEHSLGVLCRKNTPHNRRVYLQVRRQLLTHVLQMSTPELVEAQVRSLRAIPFEGLSDAIFLTKAYMTESHAAEMANDALSGDQLGQAAVRIQLVAIGCFHLLATHDPECLLAFLHSRRAQMLLREAAEADALDGACKVLLSSREVQHVFVQRWRGHNPLAPRATYRKKLIGRLLILPYSVVATIYPSLDLRHAFHPAIYRHMIPSPRVKYAIHSSVDLSLGLCLVMAHAMFGSLNALASPELRVALDVASGYLGYLLLTVWVGTAAAHDLYYLLGAVAKQYRKLYDETANPSVYAPIKQRIDADGLADLQRTTDDLREQQAAEEEARAEEAAAAARRAAAERAFENQRLAAAAAGLARKASKEAASAGGQAAKEPRPVEGSEMGGRSSAPRRLIPAPRGSTNRGGGGGGGGGGEASTPPRPESSGKASKPPLLAAASLGSLRDMGRSFLFKAGSKGAYRPGGRGSGDGMADDEGDGGHGSTGSAEGSGGEGSGGKGGSDGGTEGSSGQAQGRAASGKRPKMVRVVSCADPNCKGTHGVVRDTDSSEGGSCGVVGLSGTSSGGASVEGSRPRMKKRDKRKSLWELQAERARANAKPQLEPQASTLKRERTRALPAVGGAGASVPPPGAFKEALRGTSIGLAAATGHRSDGATSSTSDDTTCADPPTPLVPPASPAGDPKLERARRSIGMTIMARSGGEEPSPGTQQAANFLPTNNGLGLQSSWSSDMDASNGLWRKAKHRIALPFVSRGPSPDPALGEAPPHGSLVARRPVPWWWSWSVSKCWADWEAEVIPLLTVVFLLVVIGFVVVFGVLFDHLLLTIGGFLAGVLFVTLISPNFSSSMRQAPFIQVFLLGSRTFADEPWRILNFCARVVTFAALCVRTIYAYRAAQDLQATPCCEATITILAPNNSVDEMYAVGVLFALLRQTSLLYMIPGMGPYLIMFKEIATTILNLIAVLVAILIAFTGGFFTLYFHQPTVPECGWQEDAGLWTVLAAQVSVLVQATFNMEGDFTCPEAHVGQSAAAVSMLALFLGCVLILVNSLIAAMTRQFDVVWESQHILGCCNRVQRITASESLMPLPPPLTLLGLPYLIFQTIRIGLSPTTCTGRGGDGSLSIAGLQEAVDDDDADRRTNGQDRPEAGFEHATDGGQWSNGEAGGPSASGGPRATSISLPKGAPGPCGGTARDSMENLYPATGLPGSLGPRHTSSSLMGERSEPSDTIGERTLRGESRGSLGTEDLRMNRGSEVDVGYHRVSEVDVSSLHFSSVEDSNGAPARGASGKSGKGGHGAGRCTSRADQRGGAGDAPPAGKDADAADDTASGGAKAGGVPERFSEVAAIRILWKAWKARMPEDDCQQHVLEYVSAREDEVLEDGLWRTRFARKAHEGREQTMDSLNALSADQKELREHQQNVQRRLDGQHKAMQNQLDHMEALLERLARAATQSEPREPGEATTAGRAPGDPSDHMRASLLPWRRVPTLFSEPPGLDTDPGGSGDAVQVKAPATPPSPASAGVPGAPSSSAATAVAAPADGSPPGHAKPMRVRSGSNLRASTLAPTPRTRKANWVMHRPLERPDELDEMRHRPMPGGRPSAVTTDESDDDDDDGDGEWGGDEGLNRRWKNRLSHTHTPDNVFRV